MPAGGWGAGRRGPILLCTHGWTCGITHFLAAVVWWGPVHGAWPGDLLTGVDEGPPRAWLEPAVGEAMAKVAQVGRMGDVGQWASEWPGRDGGGLGPELGFCCLPW